MRKPIFGGNWKMHKGVGEAETLAREIRLKLEDWGKAEVVIFPPFTALKTVSGILWGSSIGLGAQNMFWEKEGAFTGEVSPFMLKDVGCSWVIVGHSERRKYFGETDKLVNRKLKAAFHFDLTPVVCVGETLEERKKGREEEVVERQIRESLRNISPQEAEEIVIAYEPVWAIGTGVVATPEEAQRMHQFIRKLLGRIFSPSVAEKIRIQYGGSVKPENIGGLMAQEDIDGALVGGASLEANSFVEIVKEGCL